MKKIIVKHKGKILQELSLQKEEEYSIGRGKNNQIVLPEQAGISRKHLSLFMGEEGQWTVKNLSPAEQLVIDGETQEESPVQKGFQVQDFEFILCEEDKKPSGLKSGEKQKTASSDKAPALSDPQSVALYKRTESQLTQPTEQAPDTADGDSENLPSADLPPDEPLLSTDDKTKIMDMDSQQASMSAFLKVSYEDDSAKDIFRLENQSEWTFGRDETADIMVDNPNISRKHFKISQEGQNYHIADLKSSNGTLLNDRELKPGKPYTLQSGDIIYILDMEITFEIRNLSLEKELVRMKAPLPAPALPQGDLLPSSPMGGWPNAPLPANTPGVVVEMPDESSAGLSFVKKNKKRLIIYGSVGMVLAGFLFLNKEKPEEDSEIKAVTAVEEGLEGLSEHEAKMVKRSYQTALHLYTTGKFVYCQSEIKQIHKYTNSYEDSKKLEIACAQAAENANRQHAMEEKRKKAEKTDKFIQQVTDKCREKFETFHFKHELVSCLNPAIELSPADGRVQALTDQFDTNETLKEEERQQKEERKKFIQSLAGKYHYAKSLHKKGRILKAMSAYQHFINISGHKELAQKRALAQRELASIKKEFQDNNKRMESECKSHFSAKEFKKAYFACDKASQKIPVPHNKNVLLFKERARDSLELAMKPLYEEANLNESVGNVSTAQEHWQKILSRDVPTGVYYKRAKTKMNKY